MSSKVDYVFVLAYQLSFWILRSRHHSGVFVIEDTILTVCTACFYPGMPKSRRHVSRTNEFCTLMLNIWCVLGIHLHFTFHAPTSLSWSLDFRNTVPCILSAGCPNAQNLPSPGHGLSADC